MIACMEKKQVLYLPFIAQCSTSRGEVETEEMQDRR